VISMGPPIVQVSAGGFHTMLLDIQGSVFVVGENFHGQLGLGDDKVLHAVLPTLLSFGEGARRLPAFAKVSAGTSHSLFLTADGAVFACGAGGGGRLGVGDEEPRHAPCRVDVVECHPRPRRRPIGLTQAGLAANAAYFPEDITAYDSQMWDRPDGEVHQPLWMKPEGPWEWEDAVHTLHPQTLNHRLVYHSTLRLRVIQKKKRMKPEGPWEWEDAVNTPHPRIVWCRTCGFVWSGSGEPSTLPGAPNTDFAGQLHSLDLVDDPLGRPDGEVHQPLWMKPEGPWEWEDAVDTTHHKP